MNSKCSIKNQIMLSAVALLIIFTVMVGVTYSWIEGGATYTIESETPTSVKTAQLPTNLDYSGDITLSPSTTYDPIDLVTYDEMTSQYQNLCFSPVSSADGKNFFFPINKEGAAAAYRQSTTNDIGTKFVTFNFDVKAEHKCFISFNGTPTITAKKNGTAITDTSSFRFMVSNGTESHLFSTSTTALTDTAITSLSGTTKNVTTELFSDYPFTDISTALFEYEAGATDTITVSVWLDLATAANSPIFGCDDVDIDFELIVAQQKFNITYKSVTFKNDGTTHYVGNPSGGFISIDTVGSYIYYTQELGAGTQTNVKALPQSSYTFEGWFTNEACTGTAFSKVATLNMEVTGDTTYYAKFLEKNKYTITTSAGTGGTATVAASSTATGSTSYTGYKDANAYLTATPNAGYSFDGWYESTTATTPISTSAKHTVTISGNKTYYARFIAESTTVIYVEPRSNYLTYSIWAYKKENGVTTHYSGDTWPGESAVLDSTTGYYKYSFKTSDTGNFNVIISSNGSNQYPGSDTEGLVGAIGGTYLFTNDNTLIEFNPSAMVTIKTSVSAGSGTATVGGSTTSYKTYNGDTVTLKATPSTGYHFTGWYSSSTSTTALSTSTSYDVTATANKTYYAKFAINVYAVKAYAYYDGTYGMVGGTVKLGSNAAGYASTVNANYGSSVTFEAVAKTGYEFKGWYTGSTTGDLVSTDPNYDVTIDGAITLYARFESTSRTIYFKPTNDWKSANAKFACYVWGGGGSSKWVVMSDSDGDGIYSASIDRSYTGIIFSRFDPSTTTYSFDTDWNQSADFTIPTDGKNMLTLSSGWDFPSGSWSVK